MKKLVSSWYVLIVLGFVVSAGLVFALVGENSIIAVHDNLDLFIPQFQMMKDTGTFFDHGAKVPFLGGISRDVLPAEFSLYTVLYMILPAYPAYVAGYLLKIILALVFCILLGKDLYGDSYENYRPLIWLLGLSYGVLNVFPAFGIPFASIPLVIYLLRKICREPGGKWYAALFFYPVLSYFSYFGLFILAYMAVFFLWCVAGEIRKGMRERKNRKENRQSQGPGGSPKNRQFQGGMLKSACRGGKAAASGIYSSVSGRMFLAICVLSAGYIVCEYRLFGQMLLSKEVTIRSTMEAGSLGFEEILKSIGEVLTRGMFHAESMHTYLVLPVCVVYFVYLNGTYIWKKNFSGIFHDKYNLLVLILVFNSLVYGIYYWEDFRRIVEMLCPPLTGWQFNRTIFFSPFLWYSAFFLALKRLYDGRRSLARLLANLIALGALLVIVLSDTRYNDLYHTCFAQAYRLLKNAEADQLSFREFYSEDLFETAKREIGYEGEWSAAYGFYPATLEYNGIATLDGYLGFYSQQYKEEFRKVIAPALERVAESREYFDSWGARAYLYSGTDLSIVNASRTYNVTDQDIYIDTNAFRALGGRYIFSRIELTNAKDAGLILTCTCTDDTSPYILYVYRTA